MKILVVSDTHGNIDELMYNTQSEEFDMLFYLGDYIEDGIEISKRLNIDYKMVRGNGDRKNKNFNDDEIFDIEGKKIFLTHGHKYNVNFGIQNLFYKGKEIEADYIFFGHTHIPILEKIDDIIIMNPGSPTLPRTSDRQRTFGIIEIGKNKNEKIIKIK